MQQLDAGEFDQHRDVTMPWNDAGDGSSEMVTFEPSSNAVHISGDNSGLVAASSSSSSSSFSTTTATLMPPSPVSGGGGGFGDEPEFAPVGGATTVLRMPSGGIDDTAPAGEQEFAVTAISPGAGGGVELMGTSPAAAAGPTGGGGGGGGGGHDLLGMHVVAEVEQGDADRQTLEAVSDLTEGLSGVNTQNPWRVPLDFKPVSARFYFFLICI